MALKDEIREQNKKWKDMTPEQKKKYFLTYYKWHVVVLCIILFFVAILIRDLVRGSRETLLYVMVLNNSEQYMYQGLMDEFAEYAGIDTGQYNLIWDTGNVFKEDQFDYTSIAAIQKFGSYSEDGLLEAIILPESDVAYFEKEEYFIVDLRDFLNEDVYEAVKDRLYTYHCASSGEDLSIGFYLKPEDKAYEIGLFDETDRPVMIPLSNSSHMEYLYLFMSFLYEI